MCRSAWGTTGQGPAIGIVQGNRADQMIQAASRQRLDRASHRTVRLTSLDTVVVAEASPAKATINAS